MTSLKRKASDTDLPQSPSEDQRKKVLHEEPSVNQDLKKEILEVKARINQKQEVVRKLRLVQMYRNKAEMQDLDTVTSRWLEVCQEALQDLLEKVRDRGHNESGQEELTLTLLVNKLGLDPKLLKLDTNEDVFIT